MSHHRASSYYKLCDLGAPDETVKLRSELRIWKDKAKKWESEAARSGVLEKDVKIWKDKTKKLEEESMSLYE